ncbi:protein kinase, cAMP-dependent, catalytic subunit 3 [Haematobia irritans]|uniref:protein kinase, cAMP-dependent, catalytic subunit 3 n=1 Tax=Haematobia irritans TaxID=7368 RepID=UPI003F4FEC88
MLAATCSRVSTKMGPSTNSKINAGTGDSVPSKLGRQCNGVVSGYVNGRSTTAASSESSDPLESDYSEEADEEATYEDIDDNEEEDDDDDEEDDDGEEEEEEDDGETDDEEDDDDDDNSVVDTKQKDHKTIEVKNEKKNIGQDKSINLKSNKIASGIKESTNGELKHHKAHHNSHEYYADYRSVATSKGVRKYSLDDYQIIKTVGTGTFGRVCLCRDRISGKYCAMKLLAMSDVIRLKQVEHVKNERNILREIKHPFVISLEWSTKDDCCLYMIFEYVCGGELFTYLRNAGRFNRATSNFYAAEIVLALEYLHSLQIVYRDLKPENLLINRDGHLKITDFGFAKKLRDRTWTLCGTPEYLAPEIIQSKGHNKAVDWWALGILIYEMLVGYPPFYDENPFGIYEKILSGKIEWPRHIDPSAKDLVKKLLTNDRTKRLGNMKNGADDVKRHRWFKELNWDDVYNKKLKAPIIPEVQFDGDTSNFDDYPESDWKPAQAVDQSDYQLFKDF